jgi:cytochrome b
MGNGSQIYVWDRFVRGAHWALVLLFIFAYATGDVRGPLHRYVGYMILLLVVVRLFWGVVGSKHALFSDFVCSPGKAFGYLKDLAAGKAQYYRGHNPAAAWMILFLLTGILVACVSGLMTCSSKGNSDLGNGETLSFIGSAYADDDGKRNHERKYKRRSGNGRSERKDDDASGGLWKEIHEFSTTFLLFLVVLHTLGVAASSRMHNENLVRSMITGKKDIYVA